MEKILVLQTMYYASEIRPWKELVPENEELKQEELKMARSLVNEMTTEFRPQQYKDEYKIALEKMIQEKLKGKEVVTTEAKGPKETADLMAALRESLKQTQEKSCEEEKAGAKK
jgi:DNA end-binding protein Ku